MTTSILILQLAVLGVVLESDLGRRKVGWFRVLRPVITVALVVPFFFTSLPTSGHDLLLQGAGALAGILLGLASMTPRFVSVGYDPAWRGRFHRGRPKSAVVSRAGAGYASIWIAVTAARLWFAYAAQHEFPVQLGHFLAAHQLSGGALANAFIFLAIGMDLFRSVLLAGRSRRIRRQRPAPAATAAVPASILAESPVVTPVSAAETPAGQLARNRDWASDLLTLPRLFVADRLNQPLNRRADHLNRRADRLNRRDRRRF
ncbi:MAG TPA: hypothetical protein VGI00_14120 [Streptosporangiaceae bacterium]|jgi:hypothetical protein